MVVIIALNSSRKYYSQRARPTRACGKEAGKQPPCLRSFGAGCRRTMGWASERVSEQASGTAWENRHWAAAHSSRFFPLSYDKIPGQSNLDMGVYFSQGLSIVQRCGESTVGGAWGSWPSCHGCFTSACLLPSIESGTPANGMLSLTRRGSSPMSANSI